MADGLADNREVKVPMHLMEKLRPTIEALGANVPELDKIVPKADLDWTDREIGIRLGGILKNCGLYRKGPSRLIVAQLGDEGWQEMEPHRFPGWVEKFVTCYKVQGGGKRGYFEVECSMGKDKAAKILATDDFLLQLPVIEEVADVRLPVWSADGKPELMQPGFNGQQKIWCNNSLDFDTEWTALQTVEFWEEMCGEFPWPELMQQHGALWLNRSFMVHLSACVGVFCQFLFDPGEVLPAVVYVANDQGSGKGILCGMALCSAFGIAGSTPLPMSKGGINEDKLEALMETIAQTMKRFLFFDDLPPSLFSNALNRFITAPRHTGRKYHTNDQLFDVPNVTQIFVTANNMETSKDVMQRSLWCELFATTNAESRSHKINMTAKWVGQPAQRRRFLSALWSMVRIWVESGMKHTTQIKNRAPVWSGIVGGIIEAFEAATEGRIVTTNPFAEPNLPLSGERSGDEMKQVIIALVDDIEESFEIWENDGTDDKKVWEAKTDTKAFVEKARQLGLLVELVGGDGDKPIDGKGLRKLGRRLEKYRGKKDLMTKKGRRFTFGHRRQASGTIYPIEWVS